MHWEQNVDFYKVLGVPKSADQTTIKAAYKRKAAQWHPDRNPHTSDLARRKFDEVMLAYEVLADDNLRRLYDNGQYRGQKSDNTPSRSGY
mmetsp:Transcript_25013/g.66548  ORF Transcript_25013/g.66548 Transcript_25013/m.66548 type:complete len:90 (-) Transcript_25013:246-515(-)